MQLAKVLFKPVDRIVTDLAVLQQVSQDTSFEECDKLNLFSRLREVLKTGNLWTIGYGLSAIQIAIPLRALYYKYENKEVELVNPIILEKSLPFTMRNEGCLSFPNQRIDTLRYKNIIIETEGRITEDKQTDKFERRRFSADSIEAVILQHEIDHLNGRTLFDNRIVSGTYKRQFQKLGRNDPCFCGSNKKLKHCCIDIYEAQQNTRILESKE